MALRNAPALPGPLAPAPLATTGLLTDEPGVVQGLTKLLKQREGKHDSLLLSRAATDEISALEHELTPATYCESLTKGLLQSLPSVEAVLKEPHGFNTFPDLTVELRDGGRQNFEVKSWYSRSRGWSALALDQAKQKLLAGDFGYLTAVYLDFDLTKEGETGVLVKSVQVGHIWNFTKPSLSHPGLNATGRRKDVVGCTWQPTASPLGFLQALLATLKWQGMLTLSEELRILSNLKQELYPRLFEEQAALFKQPEGAALRSLLTASPAAVYLLQQG